MKKKFPSPHTAALLASCLFILGTRADAQSGIPDAFNFKIVAGWDALHACAQDSLAPTSIYEYGGAVEACNTIECLCRPANIDLAISKVLEIAATGCSNPKDRGAATSFMLDHCSRKGYTPRSRIYRGTGKFTLCMRTSIYGCQFLSPIQIFWPFFHPLSYI
jgi:hypothetical protein